MARLQKAPKGGIRIFRPFYLMTIFNMAGYGGIVAAIAPALPGGVHADRIPGRCRRETSKNDKAMKNTFYIVLNMKTTSGFDEYGRFCIGNDRDFAYDLFAQLQGSQTLREEDVLHLDLRETTAGLPFNIRVINCTLAELGENCKVITREIFKRMNLEEMRP